MIPFTVSNGVFQLSVLCVTPKIFAVKSSKQKEQHLRRRGQVKINLRRVDKNSGPIFRCLWIKVHEIL